MRVVWALGVPGVFHRLFHRLWSFKIGPPGSIGEKRGPKARAPGAGAVQVEEPGNPQPSHGPGGRLWGHLKPTVQEPRAQRDRGLASRPRSSSPRKKREGQPLAAPGPAARPETHKPHERGRAEAHVAGVPPRGRRPGGGRGPSLGPRAPKPVAPSLEELAPPAPVPLDGSDPSPEEPGRALGAVDPHPQGPSSPDGFGGSVGVGPGPDGKRPHHGPFLY